MVFSLFAGCGVVFIEEINASGNLTSLFLWYILGTVTILIIV